MHQRLPRLVLAALLLVGLGSLPAAASAPRPGTFGPGESLEYEVRFGPVHTGRARVAVGAARSEGARQVWPILLQARTNDTFSRIYEVNDRFVTLWDPTATLTLGYDFHADEGGSRKFTRMRFGEDGRATVERRRPGRAPSVDDYDVGEATHDVASAVFWLRTRPLAEGDVEKVGIFTGRKTWDLVATVEGRETLRTAAGTFETKRVRLQTRFDGNLAARRDIVVWMSTDPGHIPVRIEAELGLGSLKADLATYLPGLKTPAMP